MELQEVIERVRPEDTRVGTFKNGDGTFGCPVTLYLVDGDWVSERTLRAIAFRIKVAGGRSDGDHH